jgi:hypothetical protein
MILYFFIIFATPVYADNFDGNGDTSSNQYSQTIAFGVNGYPEIENIRYNKGDFLAENTESILNSNLESFTDFDNTRRIPMVADHIDAPPGTQVDIVYLYRNSTGHSVDISEIDWVLSRNIKENGDLTQILDIPEFVDGNLGFKYSAQNLIKSGIYREYAGLGNISNGGSGAYSLDSVSIKNPLSIDDIQATANGSGGVDFKIYIQNTSNEYLNNLKFTYGSFEKTFNLAANQEHIVEFSIPEISEKLGSFEIYNPNVKQVCAIYGSPYYTYTQTDAIPVYAYRDGGIIPGASVQPERESFCIKRIPYTMISQPMVLSETKHIENIEASVVEEEETGDVLGTSDIVLPKTGRGVWPLLGLLVVDVLLWYSWYILRRNYESKNTNSRICTKSK